MNGRGRLGRLSKETQKYHSGKSELADKPRDFINGARLSSVLSERQTPEKKNPVGKDENDSCNTMNNRRHDGIFLHREGGGVKLPVPLPTGAQVLILKIMSSLRFRFRFHIIRFTLFFFFLIGSAFGVSAQTISGAPAEARGFSGGGLHLYPLGWSSEGRWGALIGRDTAAGGSSGIRILVIDAVTDEVLHYSEPLSWSGSDSFNTFWARYSKLVMEITASFHLESTLKPDVRDVRFTTGGYNYEFTMDPPSPATGVYTLRIQSSRGDVKDVYKSSAASPPGTSVLLGALVSPFEERALAVIREDDSYRFSGAHLTLGFAYRQSSGTSSGRLISAVFNGQEYLVRSRLTAGADPDEKDERGYPALLVAARLELWGIVADLLSAGASVNSLDKDGRTPLHYAAFAGEEDTVKKLLAAGADKTIRDKAGLSPEDLAAEATVRTLFK